MIVVQISDEGVLGRSELFARIARAAPHGKTLLVQLRDPDLDAAVLFELGRELRERTRAVGARLVVNDRLDVALALEADGVHLGRGSVSVADARQLLPSAWISRSCRGLDELPALASERPDAILLSPIFESPGKGQPLGLATVSSARLTLPQEIALVALGGLDFERARACLAAGADGVASIRADLTGLCALG